MPASLALDLAPLCLIAGLWNPSFMGVVSPSSRPILSTSFAVLLGLLLPKPHPKFARLGDLNFTPSWLMFPLACALSLATYDYSMRLASMNKLKRYKENLLEMVALQTFLCCSDLSQMLIHQE